MEDQGTGLEDNLTSRGLSPLVRIARHRSRGDDSNLGIATAQVKDTTKNVSEDDQLRQDRGKIAMEGGTQQLLSGSRSGFAKLRPKRINKMSNPRLNKRDDSNDSSVDLSESGVDDNQSETSGKGSVVADGPDISTLPVPSTSAFRSMLARRGKSTAVALALKERGRVPNLRPQGKPGGSKPDRSRRGDILGGLRDENDRSRPRVQRSGSFDSEEANHDEGRSHDELGGGRSVLSYQQGLSSSDKEEALKRPRRGRHSRKPPPKPLAGDTGNTESHASRLQKRIHRPTLMAPKLKWPRKASRNGGNDAIIGTNQQWLPDASRSPASRLPARSESSSTTSYDDQGKNGSTVPSALLKDTPESSERGERGWDSKIRHLPLAKGATPKGIFAPCYESSDSLEAFLRNIWRRLRGRGNLEEVEDREIPSVSGIGCSATGRLENVLYSWFGEVVGQAWPGTGLTLLPTYHEDDDLQIHARAWRRKAVAEDDVIRIRVLGTSTLPEDSRITRPMIVVHLVDSSTGQYLTKTALAKEPPGIYAQASAASDGRKPVNDGDIFSKGSQCVSSGRGSREIGVEPIEGHKYDEEEWSYPKRGWSHGSSMMKQPKDRVTGCTSTSFESRTVWNLAASTGDEIRTGLSSSKILAVTTQPWTMTISSSTPAWEETFVFLESYHRLLVPQSLVLFELVDFAAALSHKEARKGGGLSKIAWGFLRPIGARGECNVGIRGRDAFSSSRVAGGVKEHDFGQDLGKYEAEEVPAKDRSIRTSTLQLFKHRRLSMQARWQARQRGFPRLAPPAAAEVPDVFLQYLLLKRKRYSATLTVAVGPTTRPTLVWVMRRPVASYERERHQLSYEALAAMYEKSIEDKISGHGEGSGSARCGNADVGATGISKALTDRAWAARARRLRNKNEPCVLPDRLLHRVYAGQNGAITLAFSGSGALLAAACCDDPLPGRFPIRLFDSETGRCWHELKGHASMVYSLVWSSDDSFLLSGSGDGTAKVWHVLFPSGRTVAGGKNGVQNVLGPASTEGVLTTERRSGNEKFPRLMCVLQHAPPCFVYAAVFQPLAQDITRSTTVARNTRSNSEANDCALVVTGAYDRQLRLWDVSVAGVSPGGQAKLLGTLSNKVVHESHVNAIVYDSKNGRLYSGDGVGAVVVWRRASGGRGGVDDYSVLRKVQHMDLMGKAITSLALAPRLRRGQLLVQAHCNTLRLLDLGTYQLVNSGFAGGAAAGSLVRASFSPDGRFVVSGSENGQVRVWEAQQGKRVQTPLQIFGTACCLRDLAWHPHQHVLALAGYGPDSPVLFYYGEGIADRQTKGEIHATQSSSANKEATREAQASAEEHQRRLDNRQRLRELRIKRLRAKALGYMDRTPYADGSDYMGHGVVAALAALTTENNSAKTRQESRAKSEGFLASATTMDSTGVAPSTRETIAT